MAVISARMSLASEVACEGCPQDAQLIEVRLEGARASNSASGSLGLLGSWRV